MAENDFNTSMSGTMDATDVSTPKANTTLGNATATAKSTVEKVKETASTLYGEATDAARNAANEGKNKASEALGTMSRVVENAADLVEEKVGATYGNYARQAAASVSSLADTIQNKDVDDLVEDARDFVRKQPMVAIGAAVAIGFVLTRLVRLGGSGTRDA